MGARLSVEHYLGQHGPGAPGELTDHIRASAAETVRRWNLLLDAAEADGVELVDQDALQASGWRPRGANAATRNAAVGSRHITAQACDVRDGPGRPLCAWAVSPAGRAALAALDLWCERPQWTPTWLHAQTVPPGSARRFFVPSSAAPLCAALPGELGS